MKETALDRAQKKYDQALARLKSLKARENAETRKMDTRRKIILGGALLDLAGRDKDAASLMRKLVHGISRDNDKRAFEDWKPPAPPKAPVEPKLGVIADD